jgi:hypothetical protein
VKKKTHRQILAKILNFSAVALGKLEFLENCAAEKILDLFRPVGAKITTSLLAI